MSHTKQFKGLNKSNADIAGGKGASLGEMINSGIPVPDGFVVLADTFEKFIKDTDLIQEIDAILDDVDHRAVHTVDEASEKIQGLIKQAEMPQDIADEIISSFETLDAEFVAVRSSATAEDGADHAWAGQLDSYLNITKDNVLEKVQHCWASLFTPRAIFYRFEKGLNTTKISVAVVVQKMVNSEKSGIAFSVHPVTEDRNQLIIEAGLGLGEAIVSGSITPDAHVVEKDPRKILDVNVAEQSRALFRKSDGGNEWRNLTEEGKQQVLSEEQINELSELIIKIENHYGFPCDIEWAYENNEFFIVQSRPITTLNNENLAEYKINIDPQNYQRLFKVDGMPYLISDIFMGEYKKLNGLTIFNKGSWASYLPKKSIEKTLNEGLEIYSDNKKLSEYKRKFEDYKNESKKYFEMMLEDKKITSNEAKNFLEILSGFFAYYRKTEFFATDKAYEYSLKDKKTAENLKQIEEIKNPGREFLNKVFFGSNSYLVKILNIISEKTKKEKDYLMSMSKEEVVNLIEGKEIDRDLIKKRINTYVMVGDGETIEYFIDDEAQNIANKFFEESHESHTEIKGQIANNGNIKGRIRIISSSYDNFDELHKIMDKMEEGEILVSETTSPEIMSACSKASAIITNQGGMMSHAAIISREMGIPCIVGTQNATILLKDGDMVEVDADNGIIRKF